MGLSVIWNLVTKAGCKKCNFAIFINPNKFYILNKQKNLKHNKPGDPQH